jgi:uncharacterized phiE125 gp8 family phage protein
MRFATTLTTGPTLEPVILDDVKHFARIEIDADDAEVLQRIKDARVHVENFTRRALINQTITMRIDWCFPDVIELPVGPVQSVTAANFTYVDTDGATTQVATSVYTVDTVSDPGRIYRAFNQTWPTNRLQRQAISVEFIAGYGSAASDVPEPIRLAIMQMVVHWYEHKDPAVLGIGATIVKIPDMAESLLLPYVSFV